ncbi:hypothetical protein GCM10028798_11010 [Humibacter antri]
MAKRNVGGIRSVTRRTVILAGAPQYAGVAMAASIVPAVARASVPARELYADAVGHHFEAAGEQGSYELTLASVEELAGHATRAGTRFGLMFTAPSTPPPAGVYRLTEITSCAVPDAQLFIAGSAGSRRAARRHSSSSTGRRP